MKEKQAIEIVIKKGFKTVHLDQPMSNLNRMNLLRDLYKNGPLLVVFLNEKAANKDIKSHVDKIIQHSSGAVSAIKR